MLRTLLLPMGLAIAANAMAQENEQGHRTCGAHTFTKRYLEQQGLSQDLLHQLPANAEAPRGGTYTIPVVVHVVYNNTAENIPTGTITALINEMNQDYSASNSDIGGVRSQFTSSIGNVGFQFCLAQVDPNGNPTTGITRTQTTDTWFDPDTQTDAMKSAPLGIAAWDTERYLNIWICDITSGAVGSTITVGYAYLPTGGIVGSAIDGLVIDYDYGTQLGARTATHEIGHYFGLLHTFDEDGACVNSDGFSDTPTSNSPTFSCANTNLMKCGVLTQYENFMDYSNCTVMFTNQQSAYMANILTGVRDGLLSNPACSGPVGGLCIPTSANGTADGDFIDGVQLGSINNQNSGSVGGPTYTNYSATIGTNLTRGQSYTINVTSGDYAEDNYAVWIDYDQDETFEAGEKLGEFATTAAGETQSITFTVPATATLGNTLMRVRGVYHNQGEPSPTDPCFNYAFGETEDYRITVINGGGSGPCIPTSASGTTDGDFINGVQLGSINNQNSGSTGGPTYTDYSATIGTTLDRGATYTINITGGDYQPDHYAAWIDHDQDNIFEAGEKLGEFTTNAIGQTQGITFTVPMTAALGNTKLRVRGVYHGNGEPSPTDPCYNYTYGETEDYRITVANGGGATPCIPTSTAGTSDGDYINAVVLEDIENVNSGGTTAPAYTDFSGTHSTELARGSIHGLLIQAGEYTDDSYAAWIDYDQDDVFEASEKLGEFAITAAGQVSTISFTVPAGALLGATTMRVRGVYFDTGEPEPVDPCYAYNFGETEDYGIVITAAVGGYCIPSSANGTTDGDFIDGVQLGSINNVGSGSVDGPSYSNLVGTYSTDLLRGSMQTLTITGGEYAPDNYAAWIDYNQDQVFGASEFLGEFGTTAIGETGTIEFTVPMSAQLGSTRMRVRGVYHDSGEPTPTDPCFPYLFGETEDYGVVIETSTGLAENGTFAIGLRPNPASDRVMIDLPILEPGTIELIDLQGRLVHAQRTTGGTVVFDLTGVAAGSYLVRIHCGESIATERLEVFESGH